MANWVCSLCGYNNLMGANGDIPPHKCPLCGRMCTFVDATCYVPEGKYGGEGNPDNRLVRLFSLKADLHRA